MSLLEHRITRDHLKEVLFYFGAQTIPVPDITLRDPLMTLTNKSLVCASMLAHVSLALLNESALLGIEHSHYLPSDYDVHRCFES